MKPKCEKHVKKCEKHVKKCEKHVKKCEKHVKKIRPMTSLSSFRPGSLFFRAPVALGGQPQGCCAAAITLLAHFFGLRFMVRLGFHGGFLFCVFVFFLVFEEEKTGYCMVLWYLALVSFRPCSEFYSGSFRMKKSCFKVAINMSFNGARHQKRTSSPRDIREIYGPTDETPRSNQLDPKNPPGPCKDGETNGTSLWKTPQTHNEHDRLHPKTCLTSYPTTSQGH